MCQPPAPTADAARTYQPKEGRVAVGAAQPCSFAFLAKAVEDAPSVSPFVVVSFLESVFLLSLAS